MRILEQGAAIKIGHPQANLAPIGSGPTARLTCSPPPWRITIAASRWFPSLPAPRSRVSNGNHIKIFDQHAPVLTAWFGRMFRGVGVAIILGPISNLFVLDLDGEDGHRELVARLGGVPEAPTVLSGSGKPRRCHYYFRHPDFPTQATYHPWHPQLEFRGYRGIVIAPPSLHRSGNRYTWAPCKSLDDLPPPELPEPILAALRERAESRAVSARPVGPTRTVVTPGITDLGPLTPRDEERLARRICFLTDISERNRRFLLGDFVDGPHWNQTLFLTACEMRDHDYSFEDAFPLLLHGARPWTPADREAVERTVCSAFAAPRQPIGGSAAAANTDAPDQGRKVTNDAPPRWPVLHQKRGYDHEHRRIDNRPGQRPRQSGRLQY